VYINSAVLHASQIIIQECDIFRVHFEQSHHAWGENVQSVQI